MSSYGGKNLFGSGPHRFVAHGLSQRHQTHEQPGADGVRVTPLGRSGRTLEQTGTLLADDLASLTLQAAAIEAAMDGVAAELIDDLGRSWPGTLMLEFLPGDVKRIGPRFSVSYTIRYTQPQP
jgi:hypothetical protein